MRAQLLNGKKIAEKLEAEIRDEIEKLNVRGIKPGLSVILVGDNPASATYVKKKQQACENVGVLSQCYHLPHSTTEKDLIEHIEQLNEDESTHGILLQLPTPEHIHSDRLLEKINPNKDVDGFHPYNIGCLVQRRPHLRPCTPFGVMHLLKETGETLKGKRAVVVGASNIVGRPMALELLLAKCTTTITHRFTQNLKEEVARADILVAAIGHPGIIQSDWIKPGAIVIDVGFSRDDTGKIQGDIDFKTAKERASWITPVPGGVGPMTVAMLMMNTLKAAKLQNQN